MIRAIRGTRLAKLLGGFPLFRHRCRYRIYRVSVVRDKLTGLLFPCVRFYCRCGKEEPTGKAFFDEVEGKRP